MSTSERTARRIRLAKMATLVASALRPEIFTGLGPPIQRPTSEEAGRFYGHLDVCAQCRNNPFALCLDGAALLKTAAMGGENTRE